MCARVADALYFAHQRGASAPQAEQTNTVLGFATSVPARGSGDASM